MMFRRDSYLRLFFVCILVGTFTRKNGVDGTPLNMEKDNEVSGSRPTCAEDATVPPVRVDTSERVAQLRQEMVDADVTAYVIPSGDAHQSEYVAEADQRRHYISGFSGSAGTAVITADQQLLWTDGRYFLQAEQELDCNWMLMKDGEENVPTILEWLQTLPAGSRVGADPTVISAMSWLHYEEALQTTNIAMVEVIDNLVDLVWEEDGDGRPEYIHDEVFIHQLEYAGRSWQDKISDTRDSMTNEGADLLILTALDEIAWLFNLRGSDIPFNPVFRSYVVITPDKVTLFVPLNKMTDEVRQHLASNVETVSIMDYDDIWIHLENATYEKVLIPAPYSYAGGASYAIYSQIQEAARTFVTSPVLLMKAKKNTVEIKGMKNAHVKDAVALCNFLSFLEDEITIGNSWTEISAANELAMYRAEQEGAMGDSFSAISAFGSNGAIIHYEPNNATDTNITTSSLYLLDSGGQYLDGTTDVTRTMHYGQPDFLMIETYTRVLMGHIDLASAVFPDDTTDNKLDVLARAHLYEIGLDYNHGTGHGIGMFLGVHEAPTQVRIYNTEGHKFEPGYFFSDEPGYYKDYEFGIRLESILTVVSKDTEYTMKPMLAFEPVTLVPFEPKLIDPFLLSRKQCQWLNNYHLKVRRVIGDELLNLNQNDTYQWLKTKTEPLCYLAVSASMSHTESSLFLLMCFSASLLIKLLV